MLSADVQAYTGRHDWLVFAYFDAYSESAVNMFALTSTWVTVVMAVCRYIVVCRPLHARAYISLRRTRLALVVAFFLSTLVIKIMHVADIVESLQQRGVSSRWDRAGVDGDRHHKTTALVNC